MKSEPSFWHAKADLILTHSLIIDRPKGSLHLRYADLIYPLDYGYLESTFARDGDGINVWIGSLNKVTNSGDAITLTGILCTFDTLKRDAEIKLLIGCSKEDIQVIRDFLKNMYTFYIPSPAAEHDLSN